jgi:hypothetical protein
MKTIVNVSARFCGPPDSGNGGYVCGLVAGFADSCAEVTLRHPPPLNTPLAVGAGEGGSVTLKDGDRLLAEGRPVDLNPDIPAVPDYAVASAAAQRYTGFQEHPFPACFVCGPQRREGDGLRIFAGPVPGRPMVAAPWTPHPSLSDGSQRIRSEFVWAALDCPGYFAVTGASPRPMLLGRMAACIEAAVHTDNNYRVIGWHISAEGRKQIAGTALFSESGRRCGYAVSTWIEVKANQA